MKGKTDAKTTVKPEGLADLDELLASDGNIEQFDYDGIEWSAAGRLISNATRLGGLVSFYLRSDDGSLNISIRLGDKRKSYFAGDADQFNGLCEGLALKLGGGFSKIK